MWTRLAPVLLAGICVGSCAPATSVPAPAPTSPAAPPSVVARAPAATTAPSAPSTTVRVGLMYSASDAGLMIAAERGYLQEQSLEMEPQRVGSAAEMLPLVAGAQVEVGGTTLTPGYLNAYARGVRLRVVADKGSTAPGGAYQGIVLRRALRDSGEVRRPADLRGRKVALPSLGSTSEVSIDKFLRPDGLHATDTDLTQLAFPDMPAALASGAIDAAHVGEPLITQIDASGSGVIWQREDEFYPRHQVGLVYYSEPFVTEHSNVARRFMAAYLRAVRDYNDAFVKGDPGRRAEIVDILVKNTPVKDRALYDRMVMPALHPDGEVNLDSLREDYDYWLANGYQEERVTVADLVDASFTRAVVEQLGPYR
ncbi:MAG TPA: ABC transporter substrate-binding protein [Chloroflexota bacterium]|nr:ABC transporter substrate-binding protein [Chloroflexota bacterium]